MQKKYNVKLTTPAIKWIETFLMKQQVTPIQIEEINKIYRVIESLEFMPYRIKVVEDELWEEKEIRKIQAGKYYVYFFIDAHLEEVNVVGFAHSKSNQALEIKHIHSDL